MAWLSVRCRAFDDVQEVKGQGTRFTEQTPRAVGTRSAAVTSGWSRPGQLLPRAGARKEGQDLADGGFLAGGFRQREVRLDLVAVAAAVFLLDDVSGCGQVTMPKALRSVMPTLAAMSRSHAPGSCAMHSSTGPGRGWSGSSSSPPPRNYTQFSRNALL